MAFICFDRLAGLSDSAMEGSLVEQYRLIHESRVYGNTSVKNVPYLLPHVWALRPNSALDYGCGQSRLIDVLSRAGVARVERYDPAITTFAIPPDGRFDLVLNIDVLEHIPEDELEPILSDMARLARHAIFVVDTGPAKARLPDGRNAHVTIRTPAWWSARLRNYFPTLEPIRVRSRRRAAFKTWPTRPSERPRMWMRFALEEIRYKVNKLARKLG
jgi:hypothetical protein